jgi:hypothetical protein
MSETLYTEAVERDSLSYDSWEKMQAIILDTSEKFMKEFNTVPKNYLKAYQSLLIEGKMPAKTREKRLGAIIREIEMNGICFNVQCEQDNYMTRDINYEIEEPTTPLYLPRDENNQMCLFFLTYFPFIEHYKVRNWEADELVKMTFLLKKNGTRCEAIVLPKDIKRANAIIMETEKKKQAQIKKEIKEHEKINEDMGLTKTQYHGDDTFYICPDFEFATKLNIKEVNGRVAYPSKNNPNLQWSLELKEIKLYANTKTKEIVEYQKKNEPARSTAQTVTKAPEKPKNVVAANA